MTGSLKIAVFFTPAQAAAGLVAGKTAVVIDVLRATSCIVEAVANGARAIFPTESVVQATRLRDSLGRKTTLLCGERRGVPISGFDLGNSPAEFTHQAVAGKRLVMTTTNGTRAFLAASRADRVLAASFFNLGAVVDAISEDRDVVVVCAGKEGGFSLDDAVCAGHIIRRLVSRAEPAPTLDDAAKAVVCLAETYEAPVDTFAASAAGQALIEVGLGSDLALCARIDKHAVVPTMYDRVIRPPPA